jgi:hypothetical protein
MLFGESGKRADVVDMVMCNQNAFNGFNTNANLFEYFPDAAGTDATVNQHAFGAASHIITVAAAAAGKAAELKINREEGRGIFQFLISNF